MSFIDRRSFIKNIALITAGGFVLPFPGCDDKPKYRNSIGRKFYIDSQNGEDKNEGRSPDTAWKSLEKINSFEFSPGDKILFKAGTRYHGHLKPKGSGNKDAHIVITSFGDGPMPLIDGNGAYPETVLLHNLEYLTIRNLEITNTGHSREPGRRGLKIELEDYGTACEIHLKDLYIHDVNGSLVKKQKGGGSAIFCKNGGKKVKSRFKDLLIENCHLVRCERNGINFSGYSSRSEWHPNLNVVIRNNVLEQIPGDGIVPIACDGALVEYNIMRDCPRLLPLSEAAAGIWPWSSDNTIIQFNEVSDHKAPWDAQGFDSDWNCRNTLIQYNYSHDNEGGFLLVCGPGNVRMPRNIGTLNTVARYNISVNDGIRTKGKDPHFSPTFHISGQLKNTKIYNNVLYIPKKPYPGMDRDIIKMDNWGGTWPVDTYFANNIFNVEDVGTFDWGGSTTHKFEHNVFYGEFENAPDDEKAIRSNPMFTDPGSVKAGIENVKGFKLKKGSPCIDSGKIISKQVKDFSGHRIRNEMPDRGAFEFSEG